MMHLNKRTEEYNFTGKKKVEQLIVNLKLRMIKSNFDRIM